MLNAKERMIEQMIGKLRKRVLELEKDASRLMMANKTAASSTIKQAVALLQITIAGLES